MEIQPVKILFVEDSRADVELELRAVEKHGFKVTWERVEMEADLRNALNSLSPQVVLSDFSMPQFDGIRALEVVRETAPELPFIFVSGTIGEEKALEAIRLGATDYILKDNVKRLGMAIKRSLSDAEERKKAHQVENERARLAEILEATSDYVTMTDLNGNLTYVNAAGKSLLQSISGGLLGKRLKDLHALSSFETLESARRHVLLKKEIWQGETALLSSDGTVIPVSEVMIAHRGHDGNVLYFSTIARDIRERKAYEARIEHFANYDGLTGLPNQNLLKDRTIQFIAHAKRTEGTVVFLVASVDRLKLINESFGHDAGDELICRIADRLRLSTRDGDTLARLNSDSFSILSFDLQPSEILNLVQEIHKNIQAPFTFQDGQEARVSMSIGASIFPRDGDQFDTLFSAADAAMHRAKNEKRGGFQFYTSEMTEQAHDRLRLENGLRQALDQGDLELYYQPQIRFSNRRMIGVEALLRWNHPALGLISPSLFIPIAEESDLIHPLGNFVLTQACRQIQLWDKMGPNHLRMAINVSAKQFLSAGFLESVTKTLADSGVSPERLELEITESVLVSDKEAVIAILDKLKGVGVHIAIDDFGTGYSSLNYLSQLPIDCLKIDQSFVFRLSMGGRDAAIVQAIVSMSQALGLRVVAEGLENPFDWNYLDSLRCTEGQGYLLSRPVQADQIVPLLKKEFP